MDLKDRLSAENWAKPSSFGNKIPQNASLGEQCFTHFNLPQPQKWGNLSVPDYDMRMDTSFSKFGQSSETPSRISCDPNNGFKITNQEMGQMNQMLQNGRIQDWDPRAMLNNLSFLEQKIHQLQDLVHTIVRRRGQVSEFPEQLVTQQQQLVTADLTSIIVQLISTAGSLLPSVKHSLSTENPSVLFPSSAAVTQNINDIKSFDQSSLMDQMGNCGSDHNYNNVDEEHELRDEDDAKEEEHLPPGSYEILQLEKEEILAPHTHFCTICGKGFKRDANLRMHMRGHGDEYKTPAALAKPYKDSSSEPVVLKRYSCPFAGCRRNKDHKKFQPLKTILCVKNHYKRTHCDKSYTCSRCNTKKFSVMADLKTHEKHCGRDKWLCSCGTTFSRKDKLFGHIALFQGHTPAIPLDENKGSIGLTNHAENSESANKTGNLGFNFGSSSSTNAIESIMDVKGNIEDQYFSILNDAACNIGGIQEFLQPGFDDPGNSFSFLISGEKNGMMPSGTHEID